LAGLRVKKFNRINNKFLRVAQNKFGIYGDAGDPSCCCCECEECGFTEYSDGVPDGLVDGIWPQYYQAVQSVTFCPTAAPGTCYGATVTPARNIKPTLSSGTGGSLNATYKLCLARYYPAATRSVFPFDTFPAHALYHCSLPLTQRMTFTEYNTTGICVNLIDPPDLSLVTTLKLTYTPPTLDKTIAAAPSGAVRSANVTTYTTTTNHGTTTGTGVMLSGVSSAGGTEFNGSRIVASTPTLTTFTVSDPGVNDTGGGGLAGFGGGTIASETCGFWAASGGSFFNTTVTPGTGTNSYKVGANIYTVANTGTNGAPWGHSWTSANGITCASGQVGGSGGRTTTPCTLL
jgi:hypothetical protein